MFRFGNKLFSTDIRIMFKTTPGKIIIIQDKDPGVTEAGIIYKVNNIRDKAPSMPDPPFTGTVVAIGANTDEDYLPEEVKVGSKVHFEWVGGVFMQYEDQEYLVLQSRRITAVEL
jgi:co-chaperonin GroES (HSP10)